MASEGDLGNKDNKMFGAHASKFQTSPNKKKNKVVIVDDEEELFNNNLSINNHVSFGTQNGKVRSFIGAEISNDGYSPIKSRMSLLLNATSHDQHMIKVPTNL